MPKGNHMPISLTGRTIDFAETLSSDKGGLRLHGLLEWLQRNESLEPGWDPVLAIGRPGCPVLAVVRAVRAMPIRADYAEAGNPRQAGAWGALMEAAHADADARGVRGPLEADLRKCIESARQLQRCLASAEQEAGFQMLLRDSGMPYNETLINATQALSSTAAATKYNAEYVHVLIKADMLSAAHQHPGRHRPKELQRIVERHLWACGFCDEEILMLVEDDVPGAREEKLRRLRERRTKDPRNIQ